MPGKGRKAIKRLTVAEVEFVAFELARELTGFFEPIPPFHTRYPEKLESCVATPFQTYARKSLYKGVSRKAAILFYLMVKNHPFQNGNKRIAVTTLIVFLLMNRRWLDVDNMRMYEFAKRVASSDPKDKETILNEIRHLIDTEVDPDSQF